MSVPSFEPITAKLVTLKWAGTQNNAEVKFQYPPIVTSDNKGANWKTISVWGAEPVAYYTGAKERDISLEWAYIVTNENIDGIVWDINTISKQVKALRSYFYTAAGDNGSKNLVVTFQAYDVVGGKGTAGDMSFRIENIGVTHSNTLITDGGLTYPLKTEIKMKIKLWTTASSGGRGAVGGTADQGASTEDMAKGEATSKALQVQGLKDNPDKNTSIWY